jgi:hypothetical protein
MKEGCDINIIGVYIYERRGVTHRISSEWASISPNFTVGAVWLNTDSGTGHLLNRDRTRERTSPDLSGWARFLRIKSSGTAITGASGTPLITHLNYNTITSVVLCK